MNLKRRAGFTLLEVIFATALSSLVLLGVISVVTSLVGSQYQEIRAGTASGLSVYGLDYLYKDVEKATYVGTVTANTIAFCSNYSSQMSPISSGPIEPIDPVEGFYYCVDGSNGLWRYQNTGNCPAPLPAFCGDVGGTAVVPDGYLFPVPGQNYFVKNTRYGGVDIHIIVGNPNSLPGVPVPVSYRFDTTIRMDKAYANSLD